jgi:hypothetical protein
MMNSNIQNDFFMDDHQLLSLMSFSEPGKTH